MKGINCAALFLASLTLLASGVFGSVEKPYRYAVSSPTHRRVNSSSSSSGKKSSKLSETKSSKKSNSSKSTKSGKKSGKKGNSKGSAPHPKPSRSPTNVHPMPRPSRSGSRSSGDTGTRPPAALPTPAPPTSPRPTPENTVSIELTTYELSYTVGNNDMPERQQYDELTDTTNSYLDGYMQDRFDSQTQATLVSFRTERITGRWVADQPIVVQYKSTAFFDPEFDALPTQETLDDVLAGAFAAGATQPYLDRLALLPLLNVFRTTTSVQQGEVNMAVSRSGGSSSSKSANGAAIAAGAVGLALLAAGLAIYKRRQTEDEDDNYSYSGKPVDKNKNLHGDMTVAGETYAETYDGSVSFGSGSRSSRDEEHGFVSVDLDDSSVTPAWDGGSVSEGYGRIRGIKGVISEEEESESESEEDASYEENEEDNVDGVYEVQSMQEEADTTTTASASYFSGATEDEEEDSMDSNSQRAEDEDASTAAEPSLGADASQDTRLSAPQRPLSIAHIESLLSADLEDDRSARSSSVVSKTNLSTTL